MREKLATLPLTQLKELAKSQGIKNISGLRKAELIDRLCETAESADSKKAAAENSENKEIDVRIVYVKNKLKITVKNYYTGKIKKDTGGNFISTKSDTKNHGIGLQSVTRIVDAYGGVMEVRTDHSVFQVDIII